MDKFWKVKNSNNSSVGELLILGDITDFEWFEDDVTINSVVDDLEDLGDINKLKVKLNSNGGLISQGLCLASLIQEYAEDNSVEVEVIVLGMAASIASVIACSFSNVSMYASSLLLIHNPWIGCISGESDDLRSAADDLDNIKEALLDTYENKSNLSRDEISELMSEETFLTAEECKLYGFCDKIKQEEIAAKLQNKNKLIMNGVEFDVGQYDNIPNISNSTSKNKKNKKKGRGSKDMFKEFENQEDFEKYLNDNNYKKVQSILNNLEDEVGLEFNSVQDVVKAFADLKSDLDDKEEEIQNLKADNLFAERKQKLENVGVEVENEDKEEIVAMTEKAFNLLVESNKDKMDAIKSSKDDDYKFDPNDFDGENNVDEEDVAGSIF